MTNIYAKPGGLISLTAFDVVEVIGCAERVASFAHALQLKAIAELYQRLVMSPKQPRPGTEKGRSRTGLTREDLTVAEISAKLTVTPAHAATLLATALALATRLPGTLAALTDGRLTAYKAQIIAGHVTGLADHVRESSLKDGKSPAEADCAGATAAKRVEDRVLGGATDQMPSALGGCLRRAVQAVDREFAETRRRVATRGRKIELRTGFPDGMACLRADLPAPEAVAMWNVLDKNARALRREGEQRTLDQLRADLLVYLVTNPGALAVLDLGLRTECEHSRSEPTSTAQQHRTPSGSTSDSSPATATAATGARARTGSAATAQIHVTVGLDTLTGASNEPGELAGYGSITAELARAIACDPDSTWRRLVTDPLSGALLDYGRTTYRPPKALADHVRARDVTCVHAGCTTMASKTDLDHLIPYPFGTTSDDNLVCTCRRDHRLKHEGGWRHVPSTDPRDPVGTIQTISPTGHVYTRYPFPIGSTTKGPGSAPKPASNDSWSTARPGSAERTGSAGSAGSAEMAGSAAPAPFPPSC